MTIRLGHKLNKHFGPLGHFFNLYEQKRLKRDRTKGARMKDRIASFIVDLRHVSTSNHVTVITSI
jgi:hypothetical protein